VKWYYLHCSGLGESSNLKLPARESIDSEFNHSCPRNVDKTQDEVASNGEEAKLKDHGIQLRAGGSSFVKGNLGCAIIRS
jgi:hypothetical protein